MGRDTPPQIRALSLENGWSRPALQPDAPINTGVAIRDDTFYFGADDGVYAFDPESKEQLWHHKTDRPVHALPTVSPDAIYAITSDRNTEGYHYCLAKNGGEERWNAETISSHTISPTVVGRQAASTWTAREIAGWSTENGTRSWTIETGFGTFPDFALADGTYYGGSIGGTVHAWG